MEDGNAYAAIRRFVTRLRERDVVEPAGRGLFTVADDDLLRALVTDEDALARALWPTRVFGLPPLRTTTPPSEPPSSPSSPEDRSIRTVSAAIAGADARDEMAVDDGTELLRALTGIYDVLDVFKERLDGMERKLDSEARRDVDAAGVIVSRLDALDRALATLPDRTRGAADGRELRVAVGESAASITRSISALTAQFVDLRAQVGASRKEADAVPAAVAESVSAIMQKWTTKELLPVLKEQIASWKKPLESMAASQKKLVEYYEVMTNGFTAFLERAALDFRESSVPRGPRTGGALVMSSVLANVTGKKAAPASDADPSDGKEQAP